MNRAWFFSLMMGVIWVCTSANTLGADRGAELYKICAACHGFKAEGNQASNSPSLSGQSRWYLERQVNNFRDGMRGNIANDPNGLRMAQMTQTLTSAEDVSDVVSYILTLPKANLVSTVSADTDKGKTLYATCAACHGANAEGNQALNAPALVVLDDWYQLDQLQKFKDGRRGAHSNDIYGQQMAPMAKLLADEQAMRDVVAYITSLAQ